MSFNRAIFIRNYFSVICFVKESSIGLLSQRSTHGRSRTLGKPIDSRNKWKTIPEIKIKIKDNASRLINMKLIMCQRSPMGFECLRLVTWSWPRDGKPKNESHGKKMTNVGWKLKKKTRTNQKLIKRKMGNRLFVFLFYFPSIICILWGN